MSGPRVDVGDACVDCGHSTAFGSGRFVNRIPAFTDTKDGYLCADCQSIDCDGCNEPTDDYTLTDDGDVLCVRCHTARGDQ